ncbi:MAG: class I SAM-dependent methyltransferase [Deltaproteobacteria bacterium]|nr:class I SAM-dependent methyltransferase [Deltaproteobacteria bacterium]
MFEYDNHDLPELTPTELQDERDILFGIISRFIGYFTMDSQRESQNNTDTEYPFVPMDPRQVYAQIKFVRDYLDGQNQAAGPYRFIDIGCGIGNVLLTAEQMNFEVWGIEKDKFPFQVAAKLIGSERVSQADIWQYDNYAAFKVIYYFRPFHDGVLQRRFELLVEDQLQPGGILIANRKMSVKIDADPRFSRLSSTMPVWLKKKEPCPE